MILTEWKCSQCPSCTVGNRKLSGRWRRWFGQGPCCCGWSLGTAGRKEGNMSAVELSKLILPGSEVNKQKGQEVMEYSYWCDAEASLGSQAMTSLGNRPIASGCFPKSTMKSRAVVGERRRRHQQTNLPRPVCASLHSLKEFCRGPL